MVAPLRPPRSGLLASVATDLAIQGYDGNARWGGGLEWLTEMPPLAGDGYGARTAYCGQTTVTHDAADKATREFAYPFSVYAFDWCSALAYQGRDFAGRAERALMATQSYSIAKEFWSGTIATAAGAPWNTNVWLGKNTSTIVTAGAMTPYKALAFLDGYAANSMRNGLAYIHTTVRVLDLLVAQQAVFRDGDRWRTGYGNLVIADAGYTGTVAGQTAGTVWMVATTPVEILLGPVQTPNIDEADGMRQVVNFSINDFVVWAERDVLVLHEPTVLHAAAQVDMT